MSNTIEDELDDLARSIGLETTDTDDGPTWPSSDWKDQ